MLRYLDKGSQKSFDNFCEALRRNGQSHLITVMNQSVTKQQQTRSVNENTPQTSVGVCEESSAVECTEHSAGETRTLSTAVSAECTQGFSVISFLNFTLLLLCCTVTIACFSSLLIVCLSLLLLGTAV